MAKDFTSNYRNSSVAFFQGKSIDEQTEATVKKETEEKGKETTNRNTSKDDKKDKPKTVEEAKKNKGGRPKKAEADKKGEKITVCATADMKKKIYDIAEKKGITVTALIFYYITKGLKEDEEY